MCTASLICGEQELSNSDNTSAASEFVPLHSLETGDVLLVWTKDIGACFNALVGWSYYSHVAVVIRGNPEILRSLYPDDYKNCYSNSCIAVFESVPNRGVALFPLKAWLARTVKSIQHLSVRRRVGPTVTKEQQLNLEAFVRLVLGRDLEILTLDLVRAEVVVIPPKIGRSSIALNLWPRLCSSSVSSVKMEWIRMISYLRLLLVNGIVTFTC